MPTTNAVGLLRIVTGSTMLASAPDVRISVDSAVSMSDVQEWAAQALAERQVQARVQSERLERGTERISIADFRRLYDDQGRFPPIQEIPDDLAAAIASIETVTRQGDEGIERIRKIRFWDKNVAQKTLFQLRGDGKVNEKNAKLSGQVRLSKLQEENQLALST